MRELSWYKCYKESWQGEIVPEAFSHPAKFARGLIRKIYEYAIEQGYLKEGQTVFDPFAGVALGGLDAMFHGLHFIGCELEDKFVQLGQQNIDLWNNRYGNGMPRWGTAVIVQGDSRELARVLDGARAEGIIASPPYSESIKGQHRPEDNIKRALESGHTMKSMRRPGGQLRYAFDYGTDPANLGNMPTGEPPSAVISSPPLGKAQSGGTSFWEGLEEKHGREFSDRVREGSQGYREDQLGDSEGQLGTMPTGEPPQAVIASPPHIDSLGDGKSGIDWSRQADRDTSHPHGWAGENYGKSDGQLAAMREGDVDAVIASPPYAQARITGQGDEGTSGLRMANGSFVRGAEGWKLRKELGNRYGTDPAQLGNMPAGDVDAVIASPPYVGSEIARKQGDDVYPEGRKKRRASNDWDGYGDSGGQLAALPEGEPPKVDGIVSSPPFLDPRGVTGRSHDGLIEGGYSGGKTALNKQMTTESNGQLAAMQEGEPPTAIVSSPPYSVGTIGAQGYDWFERGEGGCQVPHPRHHRANYGSSPGQLDGKSQDTFWSAAKTILLQCYAVLAPGGVAIWVVKDFVRNKKRVDFTGQWQRLCEGCGFETIEVIKAWLVEERGTQYDLMGEAHTKQVERKSFFRRLYEFKARAAKFWESISRGDKAGYLWQAHGELWRDYHRRVLEDESPPPPLPTRTRILGAAQALVYREAGEPDVEIDTQIDYEVVLVMKKS